MVFVFEHILTTLTLVVNINRIMTATDYVDFDIIRFSGNTVGLAD